MNKPDFTKSATANLARKVGIELDYVNAAHERVEIDPGVIRAVLAAMRYPVQNDTEADAFVRQLDETECSRTLPPVLVVRQELQPVQIPVHLHGDGREYSWRLVGEDGQIMEQGSLVAVRSTMSDPASSSDRSVATTWARLSVTMPCGYHRFELDRDSMSLIVVPAKCWLGPVAQNDRIWGVATQLYLLRSEHNWGIGDFTDLCMLIDIAAKWGASVIGLNPLHALFLDDPERASPYAPLSRLFLNVLNIDVTAIPELASCREANAILNSSDFSSALGRIRSENMVNYNAVAELKLKILRLVHAHFRMAASAHRIHCFETFVEQGAGSLKQFCAVQAIRLAIAAQNQEVEDPKRWPSELRATDSPDFLRLAASHAEEIEFLLWTQWIADSQLRAAARHAKDNGIQLGLYRDLAVGSSA
jgi:4-alpha-glucanotransferase